MGDNDFTVEFRGMTIKENETELYRDDKGRLRIRGVVVAEAKTDSGKELPSEMGKLGTVTKVNDDGTVTVNID